VVDSTADFLNSAQLPPFVRVTENDGFIAPSPCSRSVGMRHIDGLVYNYGNSLSANFTGDAKNVIKIANIIYF